MKKSHIIGSLLLTLLFTSLAYSFSPGESVEVAFPHIQLLKGERIVDFDLNIRSGQVVAMTRVPKDWSIDIAAEESAETKITGSCSHGAGALYDSADLPHIRVIIEKSLDPSSLFSVIAKIRVTTDFEKAREIKVAPEKIVIKKDTI